MIDALGHYVCLYGFTILFKCSYDRLHGFVHNFIRENRKHDAESTKEGSDDNMD
jgi:hypothetical protein